MSLLFIVFEIANVKLKNFRFRENLIFDPPKLGQILTKDKKRTTNRDVFPLRSTTISFETRGGSYQPPPPRPRYEIGVHGRGFMIIRVAPF